MYHIQVKLNMLYPHVFVELGLSQSTSFLQDEVFDAGGLPFLYIGI